MKNKVTACFFSAGKKVCTSDFTTILHKTFGAGALSLRSRKRRKRRKR